MPRLLPTAFDNGILDVSGDNSHQIQIDSLEWFEQLQKIVSFRFTAGFANRESITVRKELDNYGNPKWYAYKRKNKHLRKAYVGLTEAITLARLIEVAYGLWNAGDDLPLVPFAGNSCNVQIPEGYLYHQSTRHAIALELVDEFISLKGLKTDGARAYFLLKFKDWLSDKDDSPCPDSWAAVLSPSPSKYNSQVTLPEV